MFQKKHYLFSQEDDIKMMLKDYNANIGKTDNDRYYAEVNRHCLDIQIMNGKKYIFSFVQNNNLDCRREEDTVVYGYINKSTIQ